MAHAQEFFDNGKYREAAIEYRNALKLNPKLAAAHLKLGKTYAAMGTYRDAFVELHRAAELDDSLRDAHLDMGRLYLGAGDLAKAEEEARLLTGRDPKDAEAYLLLATTHLLARRTADAQEAINQALAIDPNSAPAYLTLGRLLVSTGEYDAAQEKIEHAVSLNPTALDGILTLAAYQKLRANYGAAEATYKNAIAAVPGNSAPRFLLAELYVAQQRNDDALALLQVMAKDGPDAPVAKKRLADLYMNLAKIPEAEQGVRELVAADKGDLETRYLRGRLLLAQGDIPGGTQELEQVLKEWPSLVRARFQLALARIRQNKADLAAEELAECLRYQPDFMQARFVLARLHFQNRAFDLAIEEANRVLAAVPQNYDMRALVADAAIARRDAPLAQQTAQQLITDFPERTGGYQAMGRVLASTGKFPEAQAQFERALQLDPKAVGPLADIVQVMNAQARPAADQIARVRAQLDAQPDMAAANLLLAQLLLRNKEVAPAIEVLEGAVKQNPNLLGAYLILGATYAQQGRLQEARARYETLLQRNPKTVPAHLMLGIIDEVEGKTDDAAAQYKQVLDIDPNAAVAANNLAWHYAEREGKLDVALELARRARALLPEEPHVADTLGWVLYRRGLYAAAIEPLRESADKLTDNAEVHYHLGMAYLRSGDKEKARAELTAALKLGSFPGAEEAKRALADMG
jgi:tetratricopeptide (TPR) repeat protein